MKHLVTLALNVGVLLLLAAIGYIKSSEENRGFFRLLFLGSPGLAARGCASSPPFAQSVQLLPQRGRVPGHSRRRQRRCRTSPFFQRDPSRSAIAEPLASSSLFLPTTAVLLMAYVGRPALPVDFQFACCRGGCLPTHPSRGSTTGRRKDTSAMPSSSLDPDHRVATNGNVLEFPAMTSRTIFTETPGHYMVPYSDAGRRLTDRRPADVRRAGFSRQTQSTSGN